MQQPTRGSKTQTLTPLDNSWLDYHPFSAKIKPIPNHSARIAD
jgi:hypothetical protein